MAGIKPSHGLIACASCGLIQQVPNNLGSHDRLSCARCQAKLRAAPLMRSMSRTAALSLAALILYIPAMLLPIIVVKKLGHERSTTIWGGVVDLTRIGEYPIALIVFLCSIIIPLAKIGGMFWLCSGPARRLWSQSDDTSWSGRVGHAKLYRAIEWLGRWGMVDVLLVAVLVAAVKLGNWMQVAPGPGAVAFTCVVLLSLAASASFDPKAIWETRS